jgi:methyl-accepting chemotaxis protein
MKKMRECKMSKDTVRIKDYLEKLAQGDLTAVIDPSLLTKGNDIGQIARLARCIHQNMLLHADALDKIATGNLDIKFSDISKNDQISKKLEIVTKNISLFQNELSAPLSALAQGKTEVRADSSRLGGCFKRTLEQLNAGIDAVLDPVTEVNLALKLATKNDFSYHITKEYSGEFKNLTDNMNTVCEHFLTVVESLSKIAEGDTANLKTIIAVEKRCEEDRLIPAISAAATIIDALEAQIGQLAQDAVEGKIIGIGLCASDFGGRWKTSVQQLNATLQQITSPVEELHSVLEAFAANDFTVEMAGHYNGYFADISNAVSALSTRMLYLQKVAVDISIGDLSELEALKKIGKRSENDHLAPAFTLMMESIQNLIVQSEALSIAALDGDFDYQCDTAQFKGEYKTIISSFDKMFRQLAGYIHAVYGVMKKMSEGDLSARIDGEFKGRLGELKDAVNLSVDRISNVTGDISRVLGQISAGNLALDRVRTYKGDYSAISEALNNILSTLGEVMGRISVSSDQVLSGSSQVAVGSQNLSQGAAEQASTVEELTASISEIAVQTKSNALDTNKARALGTTVMQNVKTGITQMDGMLGAMEELRSSSGKISRIIKTIDDIAFQTNILALNAAVEAARAGQAGKGFAVVAEEVRTLAGRSANASRETTALIEETISKVNAGSTISEKTAGDLSSIADGINSMQDLIAKIAASSNEQASALSQIDTGITQVSQVVQTNSATAEESAAASEELSSQAAALKNMVAHFKLGDATAFTGELDMLEGNAAYEENSRPEAEQKAAAAKISLDDGGLGFGKY